MGRTPTWRYGLLVHLISACGPPLRCMHSALPLSQQEVSHHCMCMPSLMNKSASLQVLYFVEPIDEVAMQNVGEFDGKKLIDVSREGVGPGVRCRGGQEGKSPAC